ncbi:MAG: C10 family peptidase [Chitinispirillia bacterium]|nr:C10 family peptidase [Chitinispirillia bacterium]MCL2268110.1 C10 family peptidase [Chitinispirillia bacterium]
MKRWKIAYVLFCAVFLFSCSEESSPNKVNSSNGEYLPKMQNADDRISMEKAVVQVKEIIAYLNEKHPSEFGSKRDVESVSFLFTGRVKSPVISAEEYKINNISDTLAYVFNFKDSLGYVIISFDARVESPLIAFTKQGSLVNGGTNNPGLVLYLERMEGYIIESIVKSGKTDSGARAVSSRANFPLSFSSSSRNTPVGPLLKVNWGQDAPYNNNLVAPPRQCPSGRYVTGCVATAAAQIMSHWGHPAAMGGVSYNWTLLNQNPYWFNFDTSTTARNMVAHLFKQIGDGVNMQYGCDASGATLTNLQSFLMSVGYNTPGFINYDAWYIRNNIDAGIPVLAEGCSSTAPGCHAWVIDGYVLGHTGSYGVILMHHNWGWDGADNGFYMSYSLKPDIYHFQNITVSAITR